MLPLKALEAPTGLPERVAAQAPRRTRHSTVFTGEVLRVAPLLAGVYWLRFAFSIQGPKANLPQILRHPG